MNFLIYSKIDPVLHGLRGQIFEPVSLLLLCSIESFTRRNLSTGKVDNFSFPVRPKAEMFDKLHSIISHTSSQLLIPTARNLAAVDALIPSGSAVSLPPCGIQCTVSTKHTIKGSGLVHALEALKVESPQRFSLYFVVPEDVFDGFTTVQSYVNAKGGSYVKPLKQLQLVDQIHVEQPKKVI